jgi:hypothetical protein
MAIEEMKPKMKQNGRIVEGGYTGGTINHTNKLYYSLYIGFFAGLIWGAFRILFFFLGFTEVMPGFLLEPFFTHDFLAGTAGWMIGWAAWTLFSIVAAIIYTYLFRKLQGPWYGVAYGLAWFVLLILLIGPLLDMAKPLGAIDWNSLWTEGSVFTLWGVFIGYSISFEFTDERESKRQEGLLRHQ